MKYSYILLLSFICNFFFAQTKNETEEWIATKCNEYKYNSENSIYFQSGELYQFKKVGVVGRLVKVNPKQIKRVEISNYVEDGKPKLVWISLYTSDKAVYEKTDEKEAFHSMDGNVFVVPLLLKFNEDGLKQRMEKALLHLVKLYGGSSTIKKEAF
jgi:hypothetical protein